jgi:hypothetical protein
MSEAEPKMKNRRMHLAFVIGVLVGAIVMLVAMEVASIEGAKPDAAVRTPSSTAP